MSTSSNNGSTTSGSTRREYSRPPEIAHRLGISTAGVQRLCRKGILPGVKIGGSWLINNDRLQFILEDLEDTQNERSSSSHGP